MKKNVFLQKIRSKREKKQFSQLQMAEVLGVTQSTYSRIENGNHEMNFTTIRTLCKVLDIELNIKIGDIYIIEK